MTKKRPARISPRITVGVVLMVRALQSCGEMPGQELPVGESSLITLLAHGWVARRWECGSDRPAGQRRTSRWMYRLTGVPFTHLAHREWATGSAPELRVLLAHRSQISATTTGARA